MADESILWVEDEASVELQYLYAPAVTAGYDLHLAGDASRAIAELQKREYAAVIVDIRIFPGNDQRWIELYNRAGADPAAARLGFHLLRALLLPNDEGTKVELDEDEIPKWLTGARCAVFSVEADSAVDDGLRSQGLTKSQVKGPSLDVLALVKLIESVLETSVGD